MKIYAEHEDGTRIEIIDIETLDKDCDVVFIMISRLLRQTDIDELEERMSKKIGKKCVVLDVTVNKVLGM